MKKLLVIALLLLTPISTIAAEDGCIVNGCNGELCVAIGSDDMASICVVMPEFACYKTLGTCKRQQDGNCGWTQTSELDQCIKDARASSDAMTMPQAQ